MTCSPHIQPLQEDENGASTLQRSRRCRARAEQEGRQGRQAGRNRCGAGSVGGPGRMAGRVVGGELEYIFGVNVLWSEHNNVVFSIY